jgi:hypothetical protein
MSSDEV